MPEQIVVIAVEEPIGEIVAAMLMGAGYECSLFCTHEAIPEALEQASNCDLIVCQVAALEKEEKFATWALGVGRGVPIVATAGRAPGYLPKFVLERCSFLQGPFEKAQLLTKAEEMLNRRR